MGTTLAARSVILSSSESLVINLGHGRVTIPPVAAVAAVAAATAGGGAAARALGAPQCPE